MTGLPKRLLSLREVANARPAQCVLSLCERVHFRYPALLKHVDVGKSYVLPCIGVLEQHSRVNEGHDPVF